MSLRVGKSDAAQGAEVSGESVSLTSTDIERHGSLFHPVPRIRATLR
jgi:hypothetical protein